MSAFRVFNLLAVTTLALFVTSFSATPVNALAHGGHHLNRQVHHADIVAKRGKRANVKRCKNRPTSALSSSTAVVPTTPAVPTTEVPQPTSSSTPAPASTPAPPTGGSPASGKKLLIAWNNPDPSKLALTQGPVTRGYYDWSVWELSNNFGLEFFPQFWGASKTGEFLEKITPGKYQDIFFYNEPDQGGQANTDPWAAAAAWKAHMEPLGAAGARLWSPAVTSSPDGANWMKNFMTACSDCNIYGVAVHWYGTKADEMISFVKTWQSMWGKPLAVTEFACQDFSGQGFVANMDQIWAFYTTVMPWLMSSEGPELVAPFGFLEDININPNNQMLKNGQLTDLGRYIVGGSY